VLLLVAGDLALRGLPPDQGALLYSNIELMNDQEFLSALELTAAAGSASPYVGLLRRIVQRLQLRRLHKRVGTLSRSEFSVHFKSCLSKLERGDKGLPPFSYCLLSEIADGKYLPSLGASDPEDDVIILEMSPSLGPLASTMHACEKEATLLNEIQIVDSEGHAVSLALWLDMNAGAAASAAQAQALRAYKLSIWKALVLAPASVREAIRGSEAEFLRDFSDTLAKDDLARPYGRRAEWATTVGIVGEKVAAWRAQLKAPNITSS